MGRKWGPSDGNTQMGEVPERRGGTPTCLPACLQRGTQTETDVACALGAGLHALLPPGRGWGTAASVDRPTATISSHAHELGCQSWRGPGVAPPIPSLLALRRLLRLISALPWCCDSRAINLPRPRWEAGVQVKLQEPGSHTVSPTASSVLLPFWTLWKVAFTHSLCTGEGVDLNITHSKQ